jgi:hypothetical protein
MMCGLLLDSLGGEESFEGLLCVERVPCFSFFLLLGTNWQQRRVPFLCSHHPRIPIPSYFVAHVMETSHRILSKERILLGAAVG